MFKRKVRRSREFYKNNKLIDLEKAREARRQNREALIKERQADRRDEKEEPSRREINKQNRKRNFYAVVTIVVMTVMGFSIFNVFSVNSQLAEAIAERDRLIVEKEKFQKELENVDSAEYIEQQARTLLRMIKPGEIYYVLPEEEE